MSLRRNTVPATKCSCMLSAALTSSNINSIHIRACFLGGRVCCTYSRTRYVCICFAHVPWLIRNYLFSLNTAVVCAVTIFCVSVGWRIRTDTQCAAHVVGLKERFGVKTTAATTTCTADAMFLPCIILYNILCTNVLVHVDYWGLVAVDVMTIMPI